MIHLAIRGKSFPSDYIERHEWTAQDSRELATFLAQVSCIVALAVVLYVVGPALGMVLIATCLALWALRRRSTGESDRSRKAADRTASSEMSTIDAVAHRADCDAQRARQIGAVRR
jgi:hypothetical protein